MNRSVPTTRRYYLLKRQYAAREGSALADFWRAKQEAEPGSALPGTFPHLSRITDLGYSTSEDLDGASKRELCDAGLDAYEAEQVLAAFSRL